MAEGKKVLFMVGRFGWLGWLGWLEMEDCRWVGLQGEIVVFGLVDLIIFGLMI